MQFSTLSFEELEPGIKMVSLNRPERLNAISQKMVLEMLWVINTLYDDESCRVFLITGNGKGFCSGTDLLEMAELNKLGFKEKVQAFYKVQKDLSEVVLGLRNIPQPVVAAINGVAAGGGMSLALAADIRIAAESSRFVASFINVGATAGDMGSSYFLPRLIGQSRAAEILYTGRSLDAQEAERIGLVSRVVPHNQLIAASVEMARVLIGKSNFGLKFSKEVMNSALDAGSLASALQMENRQQLICAISGAVDESRVSFVKRKKREK